MASIANWERELSESKNHDAGDCHTNDCDGALRRLGTVSVLGSREKRGSNGQEASRVGSRRGGTIAWDAAAIGDFAAGSTKAGRNGIKELAQNLWAEHTGPAQGMDRTGLLCGAGPLGPQ